VTARTCEQSVNWDGKPPLCGEPAGAIIRAACIHEHVGEAVVCWGCLAEERRTADEEEWLCVRCAEGPDPHDCPMPQVVIPLDGAR
jgi:hypothetical protein